jgi:Carbohydrate-selective porin, OprB family/S-layer homology domain
MLKLVTKTCKQSSWYIFAIMFSVIAVSNSALAQEMPKSDSQGKNSNGDVLNQVDRYTKEGQPNRIEQVTGVNQLRDVAPTDWSFEALQSLVERYGCIAGYPNGTFRGNKSLSRYEFAAGLNACMNQIERLVASSQSIAREDLDKIQRLTQEFQAELATLKGRVDGIEARTAELEDNQFSTTTKLEGQSIFALGGIATGDNADGEKASRNTVFGNRTRLEFNTSFKGDDKLFARLSAGNFPEFSEETGYPAGELSFSQSDGNNLALEVLQYDLPIGENTNVLISATGGAADDIADTVNIFDGDGAEGAISLFGTRNPIYYPPDGAGIGVTHKIGKKIELAGGYLAGDASNPAEGNGLFNGAYSALGQVTFKPTDKIKLAATYVHSYDQSDTGTGSTLSNIADLTDDRFGEAASTSTNAYGLEASWAISDRIVLGGWGGYSQITALSSIQGDRGSQDVLNWAVTLGFPDLGKEGNLGGVVVGMEPYVIDSSIDPLGEDADNSLHVEAFYQYKLNDNIAITPGLVWINSPNNNKDNDDLVIGTVRTTFSF